MRAAYVLALFLLVCCGCNSGSRDANERGVVLLRYKEGSESTEQREQGFLDTLKKEFPRVPVILSNQYGGATPEASLEKAQQILLRYRDRATGIFAVCEPNATGVLGALEEEGLAGKTVFVGFDPSPHMVEALGEGKMSGIVVQDPVQMGYLGVKTLLTHLEGGKVDKRIPTGEFLATPENLKTPEIKRLLHPEQFDSSHDADPPDAKYTLAVIPKGTSHEFWKSVHAGAVRAALEHGGTRILWKGPVQETDQESQVNIVQDFITKKVSGIVLAPLDSQGLVGVVAEAAREKIPVVIFDSGLADQSNVVSYVATDNYRGGALAARRVGELLDSKISDKNATPQP